MKLARVADELKDPFSAAHAVDTGPAAIALIGKDSQLQPSSAS
jgi:hypothetical protein